MLRSPRRPKCRSRRFSATNTSARWCLPRMRCQPNRWSEARAHTRSGTGSSGAEDERSAAASGRCGWQPRRGRPAISRARPSQAHPHGDGAGPGGNAVSCRAARLGIAPMSSPACTVAFSAAPHTHWPSCCRTSYVTQRMRRVGDTRAHAPSGAGYGGPVPGIGLGGQRQRHSSSTLRGYPTAVRRAAVHRAASGAGGPAHAERPVRALATPLYQLFAPDGGVYAYIRDRRLAEAMRRLRHIGAGGPRSPGSLTNAASAMTSCSAGPSGASTG